jgi:hypothetical protein
VAVKTTKVAGFSYSERHDEWGVYGSF